MVKELLGDIPPEAVSGYDIARSIDGRKPYAEGESVLMRRHVSDGHDALFRASSIRRERTGIHAKVEMLLNQTPLRWSNFNIERDEDRGRLANSAHGMLSPVLKEQYPKEAVKSDLDTFCWSLWDVYLASQDATMTAGDASLELRFLLHPFLLEGGGTLLFAPPGRGKSYTLLTMAVCVDAGLNTLWPVTQAKTLMINLERSASSVKRRLGMVNFALGLDSNRPILTLNARGKSLLDIQDAVKRSVEKNKVQFIALDSLSRAGMGGLSEDKTANAIMDTLNGLGPTWLGLAHTPRKDETHAFGSVFYDAAADVVVRLLSERHGTTMGVGLRIVKENDIGPTSLSTIVFEFDQHGLYEIRQSNAGEFVGIEASEQASVEEQVEDYLLEVGKSSATDVAKALSLNRILVSTLLNHNERFIKVGRNGHSIMYGVKAPERS